MKRFHFAWLGVFALLFGATSVATAADEALTATPTLASATSTAAPAAPLVLTPIKGESDASTLVANLMTRYHYEAMPLDDAMSARVFKAYLDMLDGQKMLFTQADIDGFNAARSTLDDAIWKGDLDVPFDIFNLYMKRLSERTAYALKLLDKGFDFTLDESYSYDRDDVDWPKNEAALDELWRKRVKNDWLRLVLADKDKAEIKETLADRYAGYLDRVRELEAEDVFQSFMNAYAQSIDPHTNYLGPRASENFDIAMRLSLEGIGAVLERRDDYTQVRSVVPGGPADASGKLHAGDRIVGVGQGATGEIKDVIGWRLDDVVDLIRGPKDTTVRLEILPADAGPDGTHNTFAIVRDTVSIEDQAAKSSIIEIDDGGEMRKIGVIDLPTFYQDFEAHRRGDANYRSATRDVAALLREFKQAKVDGVIVDLRNNGGGSLSEATELTGLFIDKGPVVQVRDTRGRIDQERDTDPGMLWSGPVAVLVNRGSASASEIFAAAIQDYGRGLVIGSETFGKGTVQNLVNLDRVARNDDPTFGELKMTIAQFFRIDGGSTQLRGVTPDITFPTSIDTKEFGESSYDYALPWSSIAPATFEPAAKVTLLVPALQEMHQKRIASDSDWQLQVAELEQFELLRDRTTVSLNLEQRRAQREAEEAKRKDLRAAAGKDVDDPVSATSSAQVASAASVAAAAEVSKLVAGRLTHDDGLQADERSLEAELKREAAVENAKDVQLTEAAHILADAINLIHAEPQLAARVLPEVDAATVD